VSHGTGTQAERVARNDSTFREANEQIRVAAEEYGVGDALPFICECADPRCTEIVRIGVAEYEAVRQSPTHFINAPGHDRAGGPYARVVESRDGYDVVEKLGEAAEIATELDPRSD
jgi:hypothetical protein